MSRRRSSLKSSFDVLLVLSGEENLEDAVTAGGQHFFLMPPTGST